mmetsp:Transcript_29096/g.78764  ORF Transcript_29096/g.78764 Transcript_29096/m.78764 type:complete len:121 (+) Transcript_29096:400-762(+)
MTPGLARGLEVSAAGFAKLGKVAGLAGARAGIEVVEVDPNEKPPKGLLPPPPDPVADPELAANDTPENMLLLLLVDGVGAVPLLIPDLRARIILLLFITSADAFENGPFGGSVDDLNEFS